MLWVLIKSTLAKGGVGCGEDVVYLLSPGHSNDIGLQLDKACYHYSRYG